LIFRDIELDNLPSPSYLIDERLLEKNLKILQKVKKQSGAKILLALKGYAFYSSFKLVRKYLDGACASGLFEAKLAREELNKEVHTYSVAFGNDNIKEICSLSDYIIFNSSTQFLKYKSFAKNKKIGIRINPEVSSAPKELYNPCMPNSRLGVLKQDFQIDNIDGISGLHFHALCEESVESLEVILQSFEDKFGKYLHRLKWVNFGGGHHITKNNYDIDRLISVIKKFRTKYNNIDVYLEPGEAVGWETGYLVATVLDVFENGMNIAILDTSAEAHMPDTLAMPYRAEVRGAGLANEKEFTYRLGGNTCLAGDIMGDYSFDKPLEVGDRVIFEDQIHYTFVKSTTFNGIKLPSLVIKNRDGEYKLIKEFGYEEYKNRLS
jgi:carboxynorspermidine decarboxylase